MLKAFASAFGAGAPGWQFVTGNPDDIDAINEKFGDRSAQRSLSSHRNEILIGNDATGDWERDSAFDDINQLAMTIRLMDPKWRSQANASGDLASGGSDYTGSAISRASLCSRRSARPVTRSAAATMLARIYSKSPTAETAPGCPNSSEIRRKCWLARIRTRLHLPLGFRVHICRPWGFSTTTPRMSSCTCGRKRLGWASAGRVGSCRSRAGNC